MKIKFIIPGDRIELNEPMKVDKEVGYNDYGPFNQMGFVPKGTILEVSQMYIRKRGWYDNSITFKLISCPNMDELIKEETIKMKEELERNTSYIEKKIEGAESAGKRFVVYTDRTRETVLEYTDKEPSRRRLFRSYKDMCWEDTVRLKDYRDSIRTRITKLHKTVPASIKRSVFRILLSEFENIDVTILPRT